MVEAYDVNLDHAKPATDNKKRLVSEGAASTLTSDRYPIGCRITAVNGGGTSYDCVEVESDGTDISPTRSHLNINNIGGALLVVGDKLPLYYNVESESFFFGEENYI